MPVLDYTVYAEMACQEENAVYSSYPSRADVARNVHRFVDPALRPLNPLATPYIYQQLADAMWSAYVESRWETFGEWHHLRECPYCKSTLQYVEQKSHLPASVERIELRLCSGCGWWDSDECLFVSQDATGADYIARSVHRRAVLREFAIAGSDVPIESLKRHICRHPDDLRHISPRRLEELVGAVFGEHMDCKAIHIGGPNDEGIDVLLLDGNQPYAIQVKRRCRDIAEAVSGIREFIGAMVLQGLIRGMFVTTANRFSPQAVATARKAEAVGLVECIGLCDATRLLDVCRLTSSLAAEPWERAATRSSDELLAHINSGYWEYMQAFMGHPEWKLERRIDDRRLRPEIGECETWAEVAARFKASYRSVQK